MTAERRRPRVFSIPAGAPLLPTLVDAVLSSRLVRLPEGDPLALADLTILLPTRRAVRALRELLIERLGGTAAILPTIRPIGDVDEEDHLLAETAESNAERLALPEAVSPLARRLALTRLILAWGRTVRREVLKLGPDEPLLVPASAADAVRLAGDLARLMDDLATAGIGFEAVARLAPDDQTGYFRITLDFLKIAAEYWPMRLSELGLVDPAARRDHLIRAAARRLAMMPEAPPIIAAGSTGSIPATSALLKAIAHLPNGAVVLPGLDRDLDAAGFTAIGDPVEADTAAYGHPQFGLKRLLADIGVAREDVELLGRVGEAVTARVRLLSEAMRPAATTDSWVGYWRGGIAPGDIDAALADVGLIVARNEQEEAVATALVFRESVEERPDATVALVTPDRDLARRVAVELGRWNLAVDDSAGAPLDRLPQGVFAKLLLEAALGDGDPVALLALLKHPLAAFGMDRPSCRWAARALELALLRGDRIAGGIAALRPALATSRAEVTDPTTRHVSPARRRLPNTAWNAADALLVAVEATLGSLERLLRGSPEISAATLADMLRVTLDGAAADEAGDDALLWHGEAGVALARLLDQLSESGGDLAMSPAEAPAFLAALMTGVAVTWPTGDRHLHIWGTLEARLQSVDLLILGGLDEGVWPAETRTDPWLSRSMRADLGLAPPERRIGLSAHDFSQGFSAPRVLLTRAEKRAGAPTVTSRWLQRLAAVAGDAATAEMLARGERYLEIARRLDGVRPEEVSPAPRPEPRPPVRARPRGLSVTEIETLIRDPYAIYARHVLRLDPLDPLGLIPNHALRGSLIHDALGTFTETWSRPFDAAAEARLLALGDEILASIVDFPDVHAVWSERFRRIGRWFVAWERGRNGDIARRFAEISGSHAIAAPAGIFRLRGRADRIDLRTDGRLDILDFKTGTPPTAKQVMAGFAPQLALEAAMVRAGAFGADFAGRSIATLAWLALGRVGRGDPLRSAVENGWTADAIGEEALSRLTALIAAFDDESRAYVSRARPMFETRFESPYDHLARVREWGLVEAPEEAL